MNNFLIDLIHHGLENWDFSLRDDTLKSAVRFRSGILLNFKREEPLEFLPRLTSIFKIR